MVYKTVFLWYIIFQNRLPSPTIIQGLTFNLLFPVAGGVWRIVLTSLRAHLTRLSVLVTGLSVLVTRLSVLVTRIGVLVTRLIIQSDYNQFPTAELTYHWIQSQARQLRGILFSLILLLQLPLTHFLSLNRYLLLIWSVESF